MKPKNKTTVAKADLFEVVKPLLDGAFKEIKELSRKKQDGLLNELKVKKINKILESCQKILSGEASADFVELLDNETLPTNSDAVLILSQFETAMNQFRSKYYSRLSETWAIS